MVLSSLRLKDNISFLTCNFCFSPSSVKKSDRMGISGAPLHVLFLFYFYLDTFLIAIVVKLIMPQQACKQAGVSFSVLPNSRAASCFTALQFGAK